ncbi:NCS2 family permease [Phascolarctobacterium sp.]|uniref:NCS2 family permease n=1 Tax=Phascolarctobacterium sp. TaxID=2049039 RepID=UPI0015AA2ABF|nr:NCS2 family permease [uncultured Phascolarctobacterium sp.]
MLAKFFKFSERQTSLRQETVGGITSFVTMAYIIFVNPQIMSAAGMDKGTVMMATCLAAAAGTLLMALYANAPFGLAPGMGINAFFAYTLCGTMGYTWEQGLGAVLLSGIIFIVVSVTGLRSRIIAEIPLHLKKAIGIGIGLFILYIGLKNASLLSFSANPGSFIPLGDSMRLDSSIIPTLDFATDSAKLALVGIFLNVGFLLRGTKGGLLLSIVLTSALGCYLQFFSGWQLGLHLPGAMPLGNLGDTFGKCLSGFVQLFDISNGVGTMLFSLLSVMITMTIADMFDTIGTVLATASRANLVDENGNIIDGERILLADATATVMGAFLGTSTVTTYVESSAGVAAGARTGFASVVTALLFAVSVVLAPFLGMVPSAATAPVLIIVGILMASDIGDIDWRNLEMAIPAYFTMTIMCFGYNIADGIAIGFIMYSFVKVVLGKWPEVTGLVRCLTAMFLLRFAFMLIY